MNETRLETTILGNTGLKVTRLGAGGHFTNGPLAHDDIPRRVRELNHLLDLGVTYFDVQWEPEQIATAEVMKSRANDFTVAWPLHGADGLRGSPMNAPTQGVLGGIMAWQLSDTPSAGQRKCLLISRSAIDLPERPTAVVGRTPSGKSQL